MTIPRELAKELIDAAREELESYEIYSQLASMFSEGTAKKMLRIAHMERGHAEILLSILRKLGIETAAYPRRLRIRPSRQFYDCSVLV